LGRENHQGKIDPATGKHATGNGAQNQRTALGGAKQEDDKRNPPVENQIEQ
jgi:hypothetical protein